MKSLSAQLLLRYRPFGVPEGTDLVLCGLYPANEDFDLISTCAAHPPRHFHFNILCFSCYHALGWHCLRASQRGTSLTGFRLLLFHITWGYRGLLSHADSLVQGGMSNRHRLINLDPFLKIYRDVKA